MPVTLFSTHRSAQSKKGDGLHGKEGSVSKNSLHTKGQMQRKDPHGQTHSSSHSHSRPGHLVGANFPLPVDEAGETSACEDTEKIYPEHLLHPTFTSSTSHYWPVFPSFLPCHTNSRNRSVKKCTTE